jgi:hypothetical protein
VLLEHPRRSPLYQAPRITFRAKGQFKA